MELKVWVEGIQRIVCGVSESTTCQDVVYALAHATGKTGRFTLMERWRNNERLLAPHEHPLKILLKWGEYASDVQFILQRTALEPKADNRTDSKTAHGSLSSSQRTSQPLPGGPQRISQKGSSSTLDPSQKSTLQSSFQNRDIKKSLTFSGGHSSHLPISTEGVTSGQGSELKKEDSRTKEELPSDRSLNSSGEWPDKAKSSRSSSPVKSMHVDSNRNNSQTVSINNNSSEFPKNHEGEDKNAVVQNIIKQLVKNSAKEINSLGNNNNNNHNTEEVIVDGYYRELVKLVNQQREKISAQQVDLTKFEAEIAFAEGRRKEEESRLTYLQEEIQRLEKTSEKNVDLKLLNELEEQLRAAKKTETTSKEEISELQMKISTCDQKLAQMNARVRSIEEALRQEELAQQQKAQEAFQEEEQEAMLREIEKLQLAVDQATTQADHTQEVSQELAQEMQEAESRLEEKRKEIESLKQAMREANLEALSMTPPDEAKTLSESRSGTAKSGTIRKMLGSPRQLETAVPTSKNPHGVWV